MLELQSATLAYNSIVAVDSINIEIKPGEHVCLIGPSGCGKTSLLGLMNGRLESSSGKVVLDGKELKSLSGRALKTARSKIAWIPQDLGLVPNLRVNQNIACGRASEKGFLGLMRSLLLMGSREKEEVADLLKRVGIKEKIFHRVDHLSGGQQQRVAIARALYQRPEMILADEPVSSVDPERAKSLVELLIGLAREEGQTLVMSLHDIDLAKRYFDRVIGLREGQVVMDGAPDQIDLKQLYDLS
ncbi:MAG TPA: ABC transporter ATP-binding protein [Verrucomicrobiales bacterium]|jgi:phosphonate transport system ATP-binding protein|nr:ABC transporter ATP-binding protein [Verrucomicrobiales bacterium]|tara:strand:- start:4304 stop:5035 length:732 start_codon:yes stop_codon:yes gene_type:complete